jgi:hypothetical protein
MGESANICRRMFSVRIVIIALLLAAITSVADARRKEPEYANSADDPKLVSGILTLAPGINPGEARRVAEIAFTTGRDLKKEWRVVWPPGVQNFLVNTGRRKGGLCFQFAERLLWRLSAQNWNTVEFHWAESFETTPAEHNVIVVTAKGQDFYRGIILDNWRYGGHLVWGQVLEDPHYRWHENKPQFQKVVNRRPAPSASPTAAAVEPSSSVEAR